MSLDESISSGQAGHILDHEVIHARLKDEGSNGKLWHHRKALKAAADGTARCVIGYLGDSTTEGKGVSSIEDRPLNICQGILRDRFSTADTGRGYIPAINGAFITLDEAPVVAGTTSTRYTEGLGFRSLALEASGAMATWELHGTDMILCYASYGGATSPKSEYRIDGGAWVEVHHQPGSGFEFREEQTLVHLGVEDDYTVDWRWKSDGTGASAHPVIEGIIEINGDPTLGISVLDMGHSGYTADDFVSNNGNELIPQWVADHDVTLVMVGLGFNEWQAADSVATYKAKLVDLIDRLRDGNADLEVVLHGGWAPLGLGDPDDWHLYVDAMYEVAATDSLTSVFDISRAMPNPGVTTTADHYDVLGLHPNEGGGAAIGAADADHLSLRSGGAYGVDLLTPIIDAYVPGGTDVPVADGGTGASTAAAAATNLGLGTANSPQFTAIEVGHASDTTLARSGAGELTVEGNRLFRVGGADVPIADGGTAASTEAAARDNLGVFRGSGVPPTGALAETAPRDLYTGTASGLNSGTLRMVAIWLPIGTTVTSITFVSNSQAAVTPTNWWFGLFDSSRACLKLTADQTSTAWAANTAKTVALSSTHLTTYSGVHYLGIMMAAATPVNMNVYTASATLNALAPTRIGNTTDTGLTTPPSLPFTAGAITSSQNIVYAYVS